MKTKLICMVALSIALNTSAKAQDLISTARIIGVGNNRTAHVTTVNTGRRSVAPIKVYVELHTSNERDNPIAQAS